MSSTVNGLRAILVCILLGLAPLLVGCGGKKGPERLPVYGTVTLASGEKINGSITFLPVRGGTGPAATTKLAGGSYKFDRSNGPTAGPHNAIIKRGVPRSSMLQSLADKEAIAKTITERTKSQRIKSAEKEAVPENKTEWTESANVSDNGRYLYDFILED